MPSSDSTADELTRLRAALALAERRLDETQRLTLTGSWELDLRTERFWWSDETYRLFERPPDAFVPTRERFVNCIHPDDRDRVIRAYEDSIAHHTLYDIVHRIVMPDGRVKHVRATGQTFYDDAGQPVRSAGSAEDISDRVRDAARHAETSQALGAREAQLQQAIEVAQVGFFDHDHRDDTLYWSPRQWDIHGLSHDTVPSLDLVISLIHPDDREQVVSQIRRAHDPSGSGRWTSQYRIVRPDGSIRWISAKSQTTFAGEGAQRQPARTIGALIDITEQHEVSEAMQLREQAIATSQTAFAIADPDGRLAYVNPAYVRMKGLPSAADVTGEPLAGLDDLAPAELTARVRDAVQNLGVFQGEVQVRRADGSSLDTWLSASAVRDAHGRLTHVLASFIDMSESKRLQAQLLQAQKMESVGRLAGGIAHDFNNLLTVISGFTELAMAELPAGDPTLESLQQVSTAAESASRLTQQLLTFSRKQVINPQALDLGQVLSQLEEILRRLLGEDIDLRIVGRPGLPLIEFDRGQCEQMLINLAANARDAMPDGGHLTIEARVVTLDETYCEAHADVVPGRYVQLVVTDTGVGMDAEARAHLFEPFFTTKRPGRGTGLGLPTVFGAVTQNGGRIEVYSEPGHGTSFKVYLRPIDRDIADTPAIVPRAARGHETIVLVEDDASVRKLATQVLFKAGYRVTCCASGNEALRALEQLAGPLDLLITDVVMPGMNGRLLAQQVCAARPGTRVLYTSGYTDDVIAHHGVLEAGVDFLAKPYSVADLAQVVRAIIDRPTAGT